MSWRTTLLLLLFVLLPSKPVLGFDPVEASIPELQAELESGRITSVDLVDIYLARIKTIDQAGPKLNSIAVINPRARDVAHGVFLFFPAVAPWPVP